MEKPMPSIRTTGPVAIAARPNGAVVRLSSAAFAAAVVLAGGPAAANGMLCGDRTAIVESVLTDTAGRTCILGVGEAWTVCDPEPTGPAA